VQARPRCYGKEDEVWTCIFPGKMGLSWKPAWNSYGTRAEAEEEAAKYANTIPIPVALFRRMKEHEHRMVAAEQKLQQVAGLRLDYKDGNITFVDLRPKSEPQNSSS